MAIITFKRIRFIIINDVEVDIEDEMEQATLVLDEPVVKFVESSSADIRSNSNLDFLYVIDEINRQAAMGKQKLDAAAVQAGAFGGSRQGIQEAEAEGRRLAAIGQAQGKGFSDAMTQSQRAAQLMGGLGQAYGGLASTTADIGRVQSELGRADLGMLSGLGETGRNFQTLGLEAQRQNQMQAAQEPYTRLEIGQNLLKGIPSAGLSSTFKSATTPATNPFLAGIGAYSALQGIKPSNSGFGN